MELGKGELQISQQGLDEGLKSHVLGGGQVSGCGHRVDLPLILYPTPQPGKLKILNQNLKDALAEVERLRSEKTPSPHPPTPAGARPFHPTPDPLGSGPKTSMLRRPSLSPSLVPSVTQPLGAGGAAHSPPQRFVGKECRFLGEKL